jgi:glycosyltransferase involved in cell wall biosynthesis
VAVIVGIMKVWNEIELISDALQHLAEMTDHMFVYDDVSDDGTRAVLREWQRAENNLTLIEGVERHPSRPAAQGGLLNEVLQAAKVAEPEWILQIDVDERLELGEIDFDRYDAFRFRLFDYYITPEDVTVGYEDRTWLGPEYRDICMLFRAFPEMAYGWHDQREMWGFPRGYRMGRGGWAKHYGKAVSVERWERQCTYYGENFPEPYRTKWLNRRGKAVKHDMKSDFGRPLIKWEEKVSQGVLLR